MVWLLLVQVIGCTVLVLDQKVVINLRDGDIVELTCVTRQVEGEAVRILVAGNAALHGVPDWDFHVGVVKQTVGKSLIVNRVRSSKAADCLMDLSLTFTHNPFLFQTT